MTTCCRRPRIWNNPKHWSPLSTKQRQFRRNLWPNGWTIFSQRHRAWCENHRLWLPNTCFPLKNGTIQWSRRQCWDSEFQPVLQESRKRNSWLENQVWRQVSSPPVCWLAWWRRAEKTYCRRYCNNPKDAAKLAPLGTIRPSPNPPIEPSKSASHWSRCAPIETPRNLDCSPARPARTYYPTSRVSQKKFCRFAKAVFLASFDWNLL